MEERFFLKLLLFLFAGLIAAELLVVTFYGFRLELILFTFIVAVALTGMVIVAKLLLRERPEIESVSMRRLRQKSAGVMQDRLKEYSVDDEFTGDHAARSAKVRAQAPAPVGSDTKPASLNIDSLDGMIREVARMYGGFGTLLRTLEQLDDAAFRRQLAKAGFGRGEGFSREEVIQRLSQMAEAECLQNRDETGSIGEKECVIDGFSLDSESFDLYIQRSMSSTESEGDDGFCVELDSEALSKRTGPMPSDFSHDPKAVFSKLKKPGTNV
ncbi:hypothetical protein [Chlorobium sp. KB01]|uniref:hypothetical protein n=1 Tax=Chlorobium sp. KB01 TaxID=1917528 RepID=UPI0009756582|nr:hypothetical protein [Chlorobium sp. KB01]